MDIVLVTRWVTHLGAIRLLFAAILSCGVATSPGHAQTAQTAIAYTNTADGSIANSNLSCGTQLTRTFVVPETYTIDDIDVGVLLSHTRRNQLVITLRSPAGTTVTLFRNTGGSRDHLNVLFDSGSATSVNTHGILNDPATASTIVPPYERRFAPVESLNVFNGQNANGTWTLSICDNVNGSAGTFFQANLIIVPQPATLNVTKASSAIFDGISASNTKSVPGARVIYCITISNEGPGLATTIIGTDSIPPNTTYVRNSLTSGPTCASATIFEDDNASGADETDPHGASFLGSSITVSTATMPNANSFAVAFQVTID
jgi:uncharacterized repeat protein (TIGR01451 family)